MYLKVVLVVSSDNTESILGLRSHEVAGGEERADHLELMQHSITMIAVEESRFGIISISQMMGNVSFLS